MQFVVILAGGGGTRLWPASRRARPKQLLPLGATPGETLLAATARRLAPLAPPERTLVVTGAEHAAAVAEALPGARVLAEPCGRNTAAAIGLAAVHALQADPDAVLGVIPSDQHVAREDEFHAVLGRAFALAEAGHIVTIGVPPTRAETGFGYLETADPPTDVAPVLRFVEKPERPAALGYVASGRFLWNAGMFFLPARRLLDELARHMPALATALDTIAQALAAGGETAAQAAADAVYPHLASVSIDYGVMEKTSGILTVRGEFGWSDVGSWSALAELRAPSAEGNVLDGDVLLLDARDNVVVTDGTLVALAGVSGLVVVKSGNAILIVPRDRAQDVRELVRVLEHRGRTEYL